MVILCVVDGTGADRDDQYEREMKNSHCNRLVKEWRGLGKAQYFRGPKLYGNECPREATDTVNFVRSMRQQWGDHNPVFLAGHSRGGIAVIEAARRLQAYEIDVDCMILYDAVDRCFQIGANSVPANVKCVIHAMRSPATLSRIEFGNCGTECESTQTRYTSCKFWATHGGVGGTPWPIPPGESMNSYVWEPYGPEGGPKVLKMTLVTYAQDAGGSAMVWNWVWPQVMAEYEAATKRGQSSIPIGAPKAPAKPYLPKPGTVPPPNQPRTPYGLPPAPNQGGNYTDGRSTVYGGVARNYVGKGY